MLNEGAPTVAVRLVSSCGINAAPVVYGELGVTQIGFIGLGHMGFEMATRLVGAGKQLIVYDTRENAMRPRQGLSPTEQRPSSPACRRCRRHSMWRPAPTA